MDTKTNLIDRCVAACFTGLTLGVTVMAIMIALPA